MKLHKLSDRQARSAPVGVHGDGGGLYLNVRSKSARSWLFLYRSNNKRTELGLGPYPDIPLSRARELAAELRAAKAEGIDPRQARDTRRDRSVTFAACAEIMLSDLSAGWSKQHLQQWRHSLIVQAAALHDLPIGKVNTDDVLRVLAPIWMTKPESAQRLRLRIERLLDWAKARRLRQGENVARWRGHLINLLPKQNRIKEHYAAMPYQDVPDFLLRLRALEGYGAAGLRLAILTAARSKEVIQARWDEFDLEAKIWVIPGAKMKGKREHRVPLSAAAVGVLNELAATRRGDFILPGYSADRHASHAILDHVLYRLGEDVTVHGFRSSFRDWAAERTTVPREVAEKALAHVVGNEAERSYARSDLFEQRRPLMQQWADFCGGVSAGEVIPLRR
jgi:integrase